jgi:hypothetical protein
MMFFLLLHNIPALTEKIPELVEIVKLFSTKKYKKIKLFDLFRITRTRAEDKPSFLW